MGKKIKIVVTYIEAGMGHIMTAKAISEALKDYYKDEVEVVDSYIFRDSGVKVLRNYEKSLVQQVKLSNKVKGYGNVWFKAMEIGGNPQKLLHDVHEVFASKVKEELFKIFDKLDADIILSTHYFPTHAGCEYKKLHPESKTKFVTYDPDNNVHHFWDRRSELFITNNEYAADYAVKKLKFNPENVRSVFYICRDELKASTTDKITLRKNLGLPTNRFIVTLADGAYASANMLYTVKQLIKSDHQMVICAIAGKNTKAYNALLKLKEKGLKENITLLPYKFMPNAYELYGASDVFVTKGGPNAITDSLFMHTPIIVNYVAQPIEDYSANLFCNYYKCGRYLKNRKLVRSRIELWIDKPKHIERYYKNTLYFDTLKSGEKAIAEMIVNFAKGKKL